MIIPKKTDLQKSDDSIRPSAEDFSNRHMSFFQNFLCNTNEEHERLSNTIEFWDSVPRYSVTRRQQNKIRDQKTGTLPKYSLMFCYKGETFLAEIYPAKIDVLDENGNKLLDNNMLPRTIDYYPGTREELVEDALRKIASCQFSGFMQQIPTETSGVLFSLYELMAELAETGHTFSYQQIIESLTVLRLSHIDIYKEGSNGKGGGLVSSNYLPVLAAVSKDRFLSDPFSKWMVHFHPFVTRGITTLAYRQFNYETMMGLSTQLCRWLHKYICIKFTGAGLASPPFEIHYKTIKRDSGLLKQQTERKNYTEVELALDELKTKGVLSKWEKNDTLGIRGKKLDSIYKLFPSMKFITETKASNKRKKDALENDAAKRK